ncbi:fused response regulator/phosphatase [Luedemannella helvata]|uniref:Response regulatory domain-containing protein n=1 Tax=Luedemannella helvata TaxID=349315 RepID=A0ABP4X685_9ACTN
MSETGTALVVDDTPSKRYVLASWLRRAGFTIVEAETGTEALTRLESEPVDVVILDVKLPDMSGFDVCERIKSAPAHAATPVVHVSAAAVNVVDRTHGLSRGADAYLVEPIDPDELLATVQAVLRYARARQRAERMATRLAKLARLADALYSETDLRPLLQAAAAGTADIFDGPAMICTAPDDEPGLCVSVDGPGAEPRFVTWTGHGFPVGVGSRPVDQAAGAWPGVAWPGGQDVRTLGVRSRTDRPAVYVVVPGPFSDDAEPVLTQVGQSIVAAIESARAYTQEHQLALTLQRSLLPPRLPVIPGYEAAVRYVPASDDAEIGGDFYELCGVDDRIAVAVGDVAGHSLHAATIMAELRHATRAYLAEGHRPAAVLDRLNQLLLRLIPDEMATMCLLDLIPATGVIHLANAGHPPPLLIADGQARYLRERSPLLGLPHIRAAESTFVLEPGAVLVLYTDGLIERRTRGIDVGLDALAAAATRVDDDLERYCDRLLAEVAPASPDDDIAIVALRRTH